MLVVDIIGLLITCCLVGIRYPLHVMGAVLIHDIGRIVLTLFFQGHVESVLFAGAFGTVTATEMGVSIHNMIAVLGGPLMCYLASSVLGGVSYERTSCLLSPVAVLTNPLAAINLRLALLSFIVNSPQLFRW